MENGFLPRIESLKASTEALLHTLETLTDDEVAKPSLLPGWTRGHVLTHVARNADAMFNLVNWARTGDKTPMYVSREKRNADIEEGATRTADALVADVKDSHDRLVTALEELPESARSARVEYGATGTPTEATLIPLMRRTEVEIHHVDLDLGYTLAHLPEDFAEYMLGRVSEDYSARDDVPGFVLVSSDDKRRWTVGAGGFEVTGPPPSLLGWLLGRTNGVGLHSDRALPALGAWR